METTIKTTQIQHLTVKVKNSFDQFTSAIESLAGRINVDNLANIVNDPDGTKKYIESLEGYEKMMIFGITDHGSLFRMIGQKRSARQYLVGNPLIAFSMTRQDVRVALYAPLKVLVYSNEQDETFVEYDLPSDQFGQFGIAGITNVALVLNEKLQKLIAKADE